MHTRCCTLPLLRPCTLLRRPCPSLLRGITRPCSTLPTATSRRNIPTAAPSGTWIRVRPLMALAIRDLITRKILMISTSTGDLYPFTGAPSSTPAAFSITVDTDLWHQRLGHLRPGTLFRLSKDFISSCNKRHVSSYNACQLGRHTRHPFSSSNTFTTSPFQLIHCDLWTSPHARDRKSVV